MSAAFFVYFELAKEVIMGTPRLGNTKRRSGVNSISLHSMTGGKLTSKAENDVQRDKHEPFEIIRLAVPMSKENATIG